MLTGQSHISQGLIVQVPDPEVGENFSANEGRDSELLLSSHKDSGASCAGQTACASSLPQSSAGRSVSLPEQGLLTRISGLEYSQSGPPGRVLADCKVSSASTMTLLAQDHAAENQDAGSRTTGLPWHKRIIEYHPQKKKRNERKNIEKTLTVTSKEDSPRVLSSRAVCPSIAGSPVETTSHTPGLQADAGVSRIASSHPVTFSDETEGRRYLPYRREPFRPDQIAVLEFFYRSNNYPSTKEKDELAKHLGTTLMRVMEWFSGRRRPSNRHNRGSEKGNKKKNTGEALPVTLNGCFSCALPFRAACPPITGLSAETTSHTPDTQTASDVGWIAGNYPVASFGNTRPGCKFRRTRTLFSVHQVAEFRKLFNETGMYPGSRKINNLAASLGLEPEKVRRWFFNERARDKKNNLNDGKNATQAASGVCRTVSGSPVTFSDSKGFIHRSHFSPQQIVDCNALYHATNGFPSRKEKNDIANKFGVDYSRIDTWFKNRRRNEKKEKKSE